MSGHLRRKKQPLSPKKKRTERREPSLKWLTRKGMWQQSFTGSAMIAPWSYDDRKAFGG
jgi:hypothetical protein